MTRPRIVSLLPSCTEIACALGLGDQLVGRSHECDFPPEVRRLPVCTAPRVDTKAGSGAMDREVRSLLRQALSVFYVDAETVKELGPDLVLTQSLCDVCAVTPADLEDALRAWTGAKPRILSLAPASLADVWNDILRVAEACGVAGRGRALAGQLNSRVATTAARVRALPRSSTVACIEWLDPLMAAGNWVPELVDLAGGQNLFGEPGRHSPWLDWETLRQSDPDIIVVMPCGFDLARTRREMPALARRPGWKKLAAARNRRVCLTDGNQYFNRPGPRLVESLEVLAEIIHPGKFRFEGRDGRWETY